jgi:hypothetical protein
MIAARIAILALLFSLTNPGMAASPPERLYLGHFSDGDLDGWEKRVFSGETQYAIDQAAGGTVLRAVSQSSASGLVKMQRIDLQQYPFLNWRWKIEHRLPPRDETTRGGDDYPVRLYVVLDGGLFFWQTKSLNYVWSRDATRGSTWPNAFARRNVVMLSLRDQRDATAVWFEEKRNVLADLRHHFGSDARYLIGVAIMTDTDNTGSAADSYYGDIYFSTR